MSDADSKAGVSNTEASDEVSTGAAASSRSSGESAQIPPLDNQGSGARRQNKVDTAALLAELEKKNRIHSQGKRSLASTLGLLLLIVLVGGTGGWFVYQQWLVQQEYETSLLQLEQENAQIREQLAQARAAMSEAADVQLARLDENEALLQQAMNDIQENTDADSRRLEEIRSAVNQDIEGATSELTEEVQDIITRVSALQGQMSDLQHRDLAWLNNEASYLMRLAQRKLTLEADVASAMLLLQTVEELLSRQTSPLATSAIASVQQDIGRLAALRLPDRVGIAERLNELSRDLDALPLSSSPQRDYAESVQQRMSQTEVNADSWWAAAMELIRAVFVWRETAPDGTVRLMPDQELLIKQQLLLQLEQARLAVVQADEGMYEVTLDQLQTIMDRYLIQDNPMAAQLLSDLEALRNMEITTTLPSLAESANRVRQLAADSATSGGEVSP